jgi:uncharacterized membrane protein YphA (DoxX/SURF4 family)
MQYATPGEAGEFLTYPTNHLIGVLTDTPQATAAIEALNVAGDVLRGVGGAPGAVVTLCALMGRAGVIELVGGFLFATKWRTRTLALIASGQMAAVYCMGHAPRG